jgi:hypothetical protein
LQNAPAEKAVGVPPDGGLLYSCPMQRKINWPGSVAQFFFCAWLVVAQVWYYLQFRTLLAPLAKSLFRSVWR